MPITETSPQLKLRDFPLFQLHYVGRRPPNQKHPQRNAIQFLIGDLSQSGDFLNGSGAKNANLPGHGIMDGNFMLGSDTLHLDNLTYVWYNILNTC